MRAFVSIGMDFRFLGNNIKVSMTMHSMAMLVLFAFVYIIFLFQFFFAKTHFRGSQKDLLVHIVSREVTQAS